MLCASITVALLTSLHIGLPQDLLAFGSFVDLYSFLEIFVQSHHPIGGAKVFLYD